MIPVSSATLDTINAIEPDLSGENWQKQMAGSLKTVDELLRFVQLDATNLPYEVDRSQPFRVMVTRHLAALIRPGDPYDPILLQVLPRQQERHQRPEDSNDPLQEAEFAASPGLIHKYHNRALLIAHQACAVHCRYCFRRHYPYAEQRLTEENLNLALDYVRRHPQINEIILSGGDPLSLSDERLIALLERLDALPQLTTLRLHTRTAAVLPARLTGELIAALANLRCRPVMVLHINHARELSPELAARTEQLRRAGVLLLNQTVLLHGINDSAETQIELCQQLFQNGIQPYYLHRLDPVSGAGHFDVSLTAAQQLWQQMQARLSGYLLPRLVTEIPGRHSKTWEIPNSY